MTIRDVSNGIALLTMHHKITGKMPDAVCSAVQTTDYDFRTMIVDCSLIECPLETCCTECY